MKNMIALELLTLAEPASPYSSAPLLAEVLIEDLPAHVERDIYTYQVPAHLGPEVRPGSQVAVPFGSQTRLGYVLRLHQEQPNVPLKPLQSVTGHQLLEPLYLQWLNWISAYYLASLSQVVTAALPARLSSRLKKQLTPTLPPGEFLERVALLFPDQPDLQDFAHFLIASAPQWKTPTGCRSRYRAKAVAWIDTLRKHQLLTLEQVVQAGGKRREQLHVTYLGEPSGLSKRQLEIVQLLRQRGGQALLSQFLEAAQTTGPTLRRLEELGALAIENSGQRRVPLPGASWHNPHRLPLMPAQQQALDAIIAALSQPPASHSLLLHGVTGSGKTEVYMYAISHVLAQGGGALMLVPEIALTPAMLQRFRRFFGDEVAVLHSRLSTGEFVDEWERIRNGDVRIVIGARSAIFAPVHNLRLIVIDEEHETSFKQDDNLRYDARTLALARMYLHQGLVVLGSATPRIESYALAQQGKMPYIQMPERVHAQPMPPVTVIDMRKEQELGNFGAFSHYLVMEMGTALAQQEQIILLLNRRGYASTLLCRSCGEPVRCRRCDVSLTLHKGAGVLKCHYCDHSEPEPSHCPSCKSPAIRTFGLGTERLEQITAKLFPEARLLRMDSDTTATKDAHHHLLERFSKGEADILIGTQMVAKGLDFPKVTRVGILAADQALNLPDFRAAERTFQLLTQAAGRAGRSDLASRIVLQTYAPDHPAVAFAKHHDYHGFAQAELAQRQLFGYPPFAQLIKVLFAHSRASIAEAEAQAFADSLSAEAAGIITLLGPAPAPIARLQSLYRFQLLIKTSELGPLRPILKRLAQRTYPRLHRFNIDIDPYSML